MAHAQDWDSLRSEPVFHLNQEAKTSCSVAWSIESLLPFYELPQWEFQASIGNQWTNKYELKAPCKLDLLIHPLDAQEKFLSF